jgi:predicted CXXCH cytochrome family protein
MRSSPIVALVAILVVAAGAHPAMAAAPKAAPKVDKPVAGGMKLKPGAEGKVCMDCHSGQFDAVLKRPVLHTPVKARNCVACHNPHTSEHGKLLADKPSKTCAKCHDVVPKDAKSTHRPVVDKGCLACHDAHASANRAVLTKPAGELCAECHKAESERAAKAKFRHKPLETAGCTACHDPHASTKSEQLLKNAVPALCVGCHKTDRPVFAQKHMNYPVAKSDCTSCHDPHGSNQRGILYDRAHAPVAKQMCNQCHEAAGSKNALRVRQTGVALCRGCHNDKVNQIMDKARVHQPILEEGACLNCHTPHGSRKSGLLRGDAVSACGKCHADTIKRQQLSVTKHDPVRDGSCATCHDPHSSNSALMFVDNDTTKMCGPCHSGGNHSAHPMGDKIVDPRNRNLRLQCLSCHRAHGTEFKHMMPYATGPDLCTKCHTKYSR